jgi:hypothetical protein
MLVRHSGVEKWVIPLRPLQPSAERWAFVDRHPSIVARSWNRATQLFGARIEPRDVVRAMVRVMGFDREHIVDEIRRTAVDGVALGRRRFEQETGIRPADWEGKYWARWSDAVIEAGFSANQRQARLDDDAVFEHLAVLVRDVGHYPVNNELRMRAREGDGFPNPNTISKRASSKKALIAMLAGWCRERAEFADVLAIVEPLVEADPPSGEAESSVTDIVIVGYVYLLKSGKHYKIGRSNSVGRREYELSIQLPERATKVHEIKTDDPVGIERYWHERFADHRLNGEWFALTKDDVSAFKRRKFM